jgi:RNA-directed DNA polymerase
VSLKTPKSIRKLQRALYVKAKADPAARFYTLYDKICREDVLWHAWRCCRANGGAPGVDGQTFEQIEAQGAEAWLDELAKELKTKTYRPEAVRRVYIPKPDGKQRPLGIPTVRDRVAQMASVIVLEAIFEADLLEEQYAYRPRRSALDAVKATHGLLNRGYREVVDADLSGYFDSIPHHELMKSVARRVCDGSVLALIKMWLHMAVEEDDGKGGKRRTTVNKDTARGTPQGSPISPLLSNLYMRRFILAWKKQGWERKFDARIVNYADDYVILCRRKATEAHDRMKAIMAKLKLTVNPQKTRVCSVPEDSFEFLGYTLGRCYSGKEGRSYVGTRPSKKRLERIRGEVSFMTRRTTTGKEASEVIASINAKLRGWANYFSLGPVRDAYRAVDSHTRFRLRQWLCDKHKVKGQGRKSFPAEYLYEQLGLLRLDSLAANLPWVKT